MVQVALERKIPLLSNPPLVEAIFELRWELQGDEQTGRFRDPAYPMMYGRLYERLKKDFPLIEDLPSVQAHPETTPFVVRHRLRKERNGWPILQIGPGVATINDAKLYSWATFKPMISELISSILELYPRSVKPLNFIKAELRYINGIPFDSANPLDFLGEKLHMELDVPFEGAPNGVSLNLAYPINQPPSNLMVSANLGSVDGRAAYVVQNAVQSMGETVPQDDLGFEEWLLNAHKVASSSFVSLLQRLLDEAVWWTMKRVVITGAAGQIAYSLIFRIANGDLFGKDEPVALHLMDLNVDPLKGVSMELEDCAFPLLKEVKFGSNAEEMFGDVNFALLVGAMPRKAGMERKDLLTKNAEIFVGQGQALNRSAAKDVRVLVVGNPCNTNCLIAMHNAPTIDPKQFFAMTRLDQNRAKSMLARKAGVNLSEVTNVAIWGNHSSTQLPDFEHAKIRNAPATKTIQDRAWLENDFVHSIQVRGAEVIKARGASSAASAANAAIDAMKSCLVPTQKGDWFSMGIAAKGNPYGIDESLVFSFPCTSQGKGDVAIVPNLEFTPFLKEKIDITQKELKEERDAVAHLLR